MILKRIVVICVAIISCTQLYLLVLEQTSHITKETTITDWLAVIAYFLPYLRQSLQQCLHGMQIKLIKSYLKNKISQ